MSGDESVAEEIIELGIEVIQPGGRPDELRDAAKAWRKMKSDIEEAVKFLDKEVQKTVGYGWRGESADAFERRWSEFATAVLNLTEEFDEAAQGLDEAAKNIDEVNNEIQDIYKEIGVSALVSVGMSFLTLGVSAAVGTARVTMLVTRALDAASRLGRILRFLGGKYRALYGKGNAGRLLAEGLGNWAGGATGGMITSKLSGKGWELETNLLGGFAGATAGTAAGKAVTGLGGKEIASGAASGAAGGMTGDALESVRTGQEFNLKQSLVTGVSGAAAGGAGGSVRAVDRGLDDTARSIKNESDYAFGGNRAEHQQAAIDTSFASTVPVAGGVAANSAKDEVSDAEKSAQQAQKQASQGIKQTDSSSTDRIREDFG
ncbi:WXG100 family type VII secretion target [Streptomyces zinciresistens]|uniref:WXG100 family type VII secretion target n=1 Tax=Streptomyces zinciresistens TaxID=1073330 RepID=UPI000995E181|nr:WXG100 family type VII secretion target [Streptomyces zinciresistens]